MSTSLRAAMAAEDMELVQYGDGHLNWTESTLDTPPVYFGGPYGSKQSIEIPLAYYGPGAEAVHLANSRWIDENTPVGIFSYSMGYYCDLDTPIDETDADEIISLLRGLADYPVICDQTLSELEDELLRDFIGRDMPSDCPLSGDELTALFYESDLSGDESYDDGQCWIADGWHGEIHPGCAA